MTMSISEIFRIKEENFEWKVEQKSTEGIKFGFSKSILLFNWVLIKQTFNKYMKIYYTNDVLTSIIQNRHFSKKKKLKIKQINKGNSF